MKNKNWVLIIAVTLVITVVVGSLAVALFAGIVAMFAGDGNGEGTGTESQQVQGSGDGNEVEDHGTGEGTESGTGNGGTENSGTTETTEPADGFENNESYTMVEVPEEE